MQVTVDVKGEGTTTVDLESVRDDGTTGGDGDGATGGDGDGTTGDDAAGATAPGRPTYADLLAAVDVSPHEVSVLVDGRPVPEDQPVETDHVTVLRLIKGG